MNNLPDKFKAYDVDACIAEIYDQVETQTADIDLLRELIGNNKSLKILEPFCGNGRMLIPLVQDGHEMVGIDKSIPMLDSARGKIQKLYTTVQKRVTLQQADVLTTEWPRGFDFVILGGNCFYELATPKEQETCILKAKQSLKPNGYLYLDNDHMEGELDLNWRKPDVNENAFPTGTCSDGTKVKGSMETIWFNAEKRLIHFRRTVEITTPDGKTSLKEWTEAKHPPSTAEMKGWLEKHNFTIKHLWGDRRKSPYSDSSGRAVFLARLVVQ